VINMPPEMLGPSTFALIRHVGGPGNLVLGYMDPGTGSLLIQAILAALLAVPFLLRSKLMAILSRIRRRDTAVRSEADKKDPR
jgi:hypothetical protein